MTTEQRRITLLRTDDGRWTARDETVSVTTRASTRADALESLDEEVEPSMNEREFAWTREDDQFFTSTRISTSQSVLG